MPTDELDETDLWLLRHLSDADPGTPLPTPNPGAWLGLERARLVAVGRRGVLITARGLVVARSSSPPPPV